jgi:hypothetical protein
VANLVANREAPQAQLRLEQILVALVEHNYALPRNQRPENLSSITIVNVVP